MEWVSLPMRLQQEQEQASKLLGQKALSSPTVTKIPPPHSFFGLTLALSSELRLINLWALGSRWCHWEALLAAESGEFW